MSVRAGFVILKVSVSGDASYMFLEAKSFSYHVDRSPHFLLAPFSHSNLEDVCRKENEVSV